MIEIQNGNQCRITYILDFEYIVISIDVDTEENRSSINIFKQIQNLQNKNVNVKRDRCATLF